MIIALNNKSNLTKSEFLTYQQELSKIKTNSQLILCPSDIHIGIFNLSNCFLGSQNVSKDFIGAHTGEISAQQLKSYGVTYCIVGHSERRETQKETSLEINEKIKRLLKEDIIPIVCIGESKEIRESNQATEYIEKELKTLIYDLEKDEQQKLIIAYEPIWSIGTGILPTNDEIENIFLIIKKYFPTNKILYGGSANENNIETLKKCSIIDGYLLGGLSLKPKELEVFTKKLEN